MDLKLFIDADRDLRLKRRLQRDVGERGRTKESVCRQFEATVKPMHDKFVEPGRCFADIVLPGGEITPAALDLLIAKIRSIIY